MAHSRAKRSQMAENAKKKTDKDWIQQAIKHPGALRETLGIKKGQDIPAQKLEQATHSKNPLTKKRAVFAETLKSFGSKK